MAKKTKKVNVEKFVKKLGNKFLDKSRELGLCISQEDILEDIASIAVNHTKCIKKGEIELITYSGKDTDKIVSVSIECNRCGNILLESESIVDAKIERVNKPEELDKTVDDLVGSSIDLYELMNRANKKNVYSHHTGVVKEEVKTLVSNRLTTPGFNLWESPVVKGLLERGYSKETIMDKIAIYVDNEAEDLFTSVINSIEGVLDDILNDPAKALEVLDVDITLEALNITGEKIEVIVPVEVKVEIVEEKVPAKKTPTKKADTKKADTKKVEAKIEDIKVEVEVKDADNKTVAKKTTTKEVTTKK